MIRQGKGDDGTFTCSDAALNIRLQRSVGNTHAVKPCRNGIYHNDKVLLL